MILKRKIRKANRLFKLKALKDYDTGDEIPQRQDGVQPAEIAYQKTLQYKNLFKNYGRAICCFIVSELSDPYLDSMLIGLEVDKAQFKSYVQEKKKTILGIIEFEDLFFIQSRDSTVVRCYKNLIVKLSEIFIKYFSTNWIIHGKLQYKMIYLKCRMKILKKIQRIHQISMKQTCS